MNTIITIMVISIYTFIVTGIYNASKEQERQKNDYNAQK